MERMQFERIALFERNEADKISERMQIGELGLPNKACGSWHGRLSVFDRSYSRRDCLLMPGRHMREEVNLAYI